MSLVHPIDRPLEYIYTHVYIPVDNLGGSVATAKLSKWGTGQGFHITKAGMEMTGTSIGDAYDVEYLPGMIVFRLQDQEHRKVKRKKITLEEAFEGWNGSRETQDPWGNDANTLNGAEKDVWG